MAGLSSSGFVVKTLADIKSEIESTIRGDFGAGARLVISVFENLIGVFSDRIAELWDGLQAAFSAMDPDKAQDAAQDALCAITGTVREAAAPTIVTVSCTGTPATSLTTGRVVSIVTTGVRFTSTEDATILAVNAWVHTTAYAVGARFYATSAGITRVYEVTSPGTSAVGAGAAPFLEVADILDGSCVIDYIGRGTGAVDVEFEAEDTGAIPAPARTLTVIETSVNGWDSAMNLDGESDLGRDDETNVELRIRREEELASGGINTDAIRAAILDVDGVTQCYVFSNTTNATDGDGVPAHAIEVVALGGAAADIREALWDACGGLVQTHGSTSGTITDTQGFTQTVKFSRPTEVRVYVIANVTRDTSTFPATGEADIKAALVAFADLQRFGKNCVSHALKAQLFPVIDSDGIAVSGITGVLEIPTLYINTTPAPAIETTIAISTRQIFTIDTVDVTVNLSAGTP